ncbi:hypothetical protein GDO81_013871 [Engystomops pustulosus]|uniref:Uncharacterized protein n=1 Tax=Engystomops pustulosus TaxID=76066 RepID=A0AAV7B6L7_ENGPU|nr:hypothetical protein GDO81_013871 [Engystomops pustulosus]
MDDDVWKNRGPHCAMRASDPRILLRFMSKYYIKLMVWFLALGMVSTEKGCPYILLFMQDTTAWPHTNNKNGVLFTVKGK